jgi:hypothetical protein
MASTGRCCELQESDAFPLGYILFTLPGTDSGSAFPCVRILFPESALGRTNYLVVAVSYEHSGGHRAGVPLRT